MTQALARLGMSPGLPAVLDRVPPAKRGALALLIRDSGVPVAVLDRYETWAVALTLAAVGLKDLPVSAESGAEPILKQSFEQAGKPVEGLETAEEQLGYFDGLPEAAQRDFLVSVVDERGAIGSEFKTMIRAWSSGDVRAIAATFDDEFRTSEALAEALLHRRNAKWASTLAARMDRPGTVFVAVGAGHLAGAGSVEDLLSARGFKVTRVE